ncbi:hypothetical protein ACFXIY_05510 [Streptomyces albidoflavus]
MSPGLSRRCREVPSRAPVVCVSTSAGFKDQGAGRGLREAPVAEWEAARARLLAAGLRE